MLLHYASLNFHKKLIISAKNAEISVFNGIISKDSFFTFVSVIFENYFFNIMSPKFVSA